MGRWGTLHKVAREQKVRREGRGQNRAGPNRQGGARALALRGFEQGEYSQVKQGPGGAPRRSPTVCAAVGLSAPLSVPRTPQPKLQPSCLFSERYISLPFPCPSQPPACWPSTGLSCGPSGPLRGGCSAGPEGREAPPLPSVHTGLAPPAARLAQEGGDFPPTAAGARGSERVPCASLLSPEQHLWLGGTGPQIPRRARAVLFWILPPASESRARPFLSE